MPSRSGELDLVKCGPFMGVDTTTAGPYMHEGMASAASNVDPSTTLGGMTNAKGRQQIVDLGVTLLGPAFQVAQYVANENIVLGNPGNRFFVAAFDASTPAPVIAYDPDHAAQTNLTNGLAFIKAEQFQNTLYTNSGQQLRQTSTLNNSSVGMFQWTQDRTAAGPQYPAGVTFTNTSPGNIADGTTVYYTLTQTITYPDGRTQETGPDAGSNPQTSAWNFTTIGSTFKITLTPGVPWSGFYTEGSTYTTNIYRYSSNQPVWIRIAAGLTGSTPYLDNISDPSLVATGNPQLIFRDTPPLFGGSLPFGPRVQGTIFVHKNRVWQFVTLLPTTPINHALNQLQLWYSDNGVGWSFNAATQVSLLESTQLAQPGFGFTPPNVPGEYPVAGLSLSSVAILWTNARTFIVYGDDPSTFVARSVFNVGCFAPRSAAVCNDIVAWLSPEGVYLFDGYQRKLISEPIRATLPIDSSAVGWYSGRKYFLSFPNQNVTWVYYFPTQQWWSLPYACSGAFAIQYEGPTYIDAAQTSEEIVAIRANTSTLDSWYQGNQDLGSPITQTWVSPLTDSGKPQLQKSYDYVTLNAPIQTGTATVTLQIDPGSLPTKTYSWTVNLAVCPSSTWSVPTPCEGFLAQLTVSTTSSTPVTIYSCNVYGTVAAASYPFANNAVTAV